MSIFDDVFEKIFHPARPVEDVDLPKAMSGTVNLKYIEHEIIRFPEVMEADQVYSSLYLNSLAGFSESIYDKLTALVTGPFRNVPDSDVVLNGIIMGDIYGAPFERIGGKITPYDINKVPFPESHGSCTDDTVMTLAVKQAISQITSHTYSHDAKLATFAETYRAFASKYPYAGYGGRFYDWAVLKIDDPHYISCGDGSAMRSGIIGGIVPDLKDCIFFALLSALPTHAHPEGIKGAVATAVITWYAAHGASKEDLHRIALLFYPHGAQTTAQWNDDDFGYLAPDLTLEEMIELHPITLNATCQIAVPLSISLMLLSNSFEDFIKHLTMIPMDADTVGAIMGGAMASYACHHGQHPDFTATKEALQELSI